jgi:LmbE family N-acetylglucosaminyl deacetylase
MQLGTLLGVWAHPDDESWLAAGLMMAARENGDRVVCVTATRGEAGVADPGRWPLAKLGAIRQKELVASLRIMDIPEHYWLDYTDGRCITVDTDEAVNKLAAIIRKVQPDTILTFGPDGLTGHDDHKTVSHWTTLAVRRTNSPARVLQAVYSLEWYERLGKKLDQQFNMFFNIKQPPLVAEDQADISFMLPPELIERKLAALRAQACQTEAMFMRVPLEELRDTVRCECFMDAK